MRNVSRLDRAFLSWVTVCAGFTAVASAGRGDWLSAAMAGPCAAATGATLLFGPRLRDQLHARTLRRAIARRPGMGWPLQHVYSEHGREVLEAAERDPVLEADVAEHAADVAAGFEHCLGEAEDRGPRTDHYLLMGYLQGRATGVRDVITDPGVAFEPWLGPYSWARIRLAAICQLAIREGALQPHTGTPLYR